MPQPTLIPHAKCPDCDAMVPGVYSKGAQIVIYRCPCGTQFTPPIEKT